MVMSNCKMKSCFSFPKNMTINNYITNHEHLLINPSQRDEFNSRRSKIHHGSNAQR